MIFDEARELHAEVYGPGGMDNRSCLRSKIVLDVFREAESGRGEFAWMVLYLRGCGVEGGFVAREEGLRNSFVGCGLRGSADEAVDLGDVMGRAEEGEVVRAQCTGCASEDDGVSVGCKRDAGR